MTAASQLRDTADELCEAAALNHAQELALVNLATREIDSLAERIVALEHRHRVPRSEIRALLRDVRELIHLNQRERGCNHTAAGQVDRLIQAAKTPQALTVKGLARLLARPLDTLAALYDGEHVAERDLAAARAAVRQAAAIAPAGRLTDPDSRLLHELRGRRWAALQHAMQELAR